MVTKNENGLPVREAKVLEVPAVEARFGTATLTQLGEPLGVPVNEPITWPQLLGGMASDLFTFLLAALPGLVTFLASTAPITSRALVAVALSAIVAGLIAVQKLTMTDGLSMRTRAMGQTNGGR